MNKAKKEQLILLAAVAVFLLILPRVLFSKKPVRTYPLNPFGQGQAEYNKSVEQGVRAVEPTVSPLVDKDAQVKDPFDISDDLIKKMLIDKAREEGQPAAGNDIAEVELQGVVWGADNPFAFINGKVYKIGDFIAEAQILDIKKEGVYFLYNGDRVLVKLKKQT